MSNDAIVPALQIAQQLLHHILQSGLLKPRGLWFARSAAVDGRRTHFNLMAVVPKQYSEYLIASIKLDAAAPHLAREYQRTVRHLGDGNEPIAFSNLMQAAPKKTASYFSAAAAFIEKAYPTLYAQFGGDPEDQENVDSYKASCKQLIKQLRERAALAKDE